MKHFSRNHGKALHGLGMRIVAGIISGNRESCSLVEQLQSFRESRPATGPCLETHPDPAKTQQKKKKRHCHSCDSQPQKGFTFLRLAITLNNAYPIGNQESIKRCARRRTIEDESNKQVLNIDINRAINYGDVHL